jgi:hypothetical protein
MGRKFKRARKRILVEGKIKRHAIVKEVVNFFIRYEHEKKGSGIGFKYPVEKLPDAYLYISRPGNKKNFDFKVEVKQDFGLGDGSHLNMVESLRNLRILEAEKFQILFKTIEKIYHCEENDVDKILVSYSESDLTFSDGTKIEVFAKVIKWLFIMEDIVYWDNEGRAFLFNFIKYYVYETDLERLKEVKEKVVKRPLFLKTYMNKSGIGWVISRG